MDQRIDACGLKRIAAHQQRVEGEHLTESVILNVRVDKCSDTAIRAQTNQIWEHLQHVDQPRERLIDQIESSAEDRRGLGIELLVPTHIARVERTNLLNHFLALPVVAEHRSVLESHVIERIDRYDLHVVVSLLATQFEELVDQPGGCNDGWTTIEDEAVLLVDIGTSAWFVALFNDFDIETLGAQANSCDQTTESATNDDDFHVNL